jgi:diguanylate cyclase (GGDEF)-like protein
MLVAVLTIVLAAEAPGSPAWRAGIAVALAAGGACIASLAVWHTHARWNARQSDAVRRRLEEMAARDELTGLMNGASLRETLRRETAERSLSVPGTFALILFDLDNFKEINDRLGPGVGDEIMATVGRTLAVRAGEGGVAARQGGDEFAILLRDVDARQASRCAHEIREAIREASLNASAANAHQAVTASVGMAMYPADGADAETLLTAAGRALYRAKARWNGEASRSEERDSQEVFFAIGDALARTLDPKDRVNDLCRAVGSVLHLEGCAIWLAEPDGEFRANAYYVRERAMFDNFSKVMSEAPLTSEEADATGVLRTHHYYIDDIRNADRWPPRYRNLFGERRWMFGVPINGERSGMLFLVASHDDVAPPATGLVLAIARLIEAGLRSADTYSRARRQGQQLSDLAGLGGLLVGDGDFESQLENAARRIVEITGFEMITIDTDDPTGQQPFVRSFFGVAPKGAEFNAEQAQAWRSMRPALTEPEIVEFLESIHDPIVMDDPINQVPEMYRDVISASNVRSVVIMPLKWRGEVNGLMYVASYRQQAFGDSDIALMHTIAAQLAPAIQVAALNVELEHSYAELKEAHLHALLRLAYAAEARDPYTECHLQRIRAISQAIGRRLGVENDDLEALGYGAIVHDLGKLRVPDSILTNPGALNDDEWAQMKLHPRWGADIIGDNVFYNVAREVALHHHERWDGSGYPDGLSGEEIPLAARIVSVADVYDALTSARPYKHAWAPERALVEIMRMRGKTLCPRSVDVFMELWREGEIARIDAETADESMEFDFRGLYAA